MAQSTDSQKEEDPIIRILKELSNKITYQPTLKRKKREGMCLLSGDEKSSQEDNYIRIETDSELDEINLENLKENKNLIEIKDDPILEKEMIKIKA